MADEETNPPAEGLQAAPKAVPRRRSAAFRNGVLAKLPRLTSTNWQAQEADDVYDEMQGITALDADAFLQPLERLAEKQHG